jgi:hypothetical protein
LFERGKRGRGERNENGGDERRTEIASSSA